MFEDCLKSGKDQHDEWCDLAVTIPRLYKMTKSMPQQQKQIALSELKWKLDLYKAPFWLPC